MTQPHKLVDKRCLLILIGLTLLLTGCRGDSAVDSSQSQTKNPQAADSSVASDSTNTPDKQSQRNSAPATSSQSPQSYELDVSKLVASVLPQNILKEGWVRLFDGQSLYGWFTAGNANWRVADGAIQVDEGEPSFLCTSIQLADYELKVEFRCDAQTNSGIFLRTPPVPEDPAHDSLELNIAPPDNPFPTGSFVKRQKLEPQQLGSFDPTTWHTFLIHAEGDLVRVSLDDKPIIEIKDKAKLGRGYISLQHNQGHVEFRNILLRPLGAQSLAVGENWEQDWQKIEKEKLTVTATQEGLRLQGGLGQLQSKADYGDFVLQATYQLAKPEVNSGIFFRCVRDAMLDGYECQLNHAMLDDDPLRPADAGAGAIFRRQPARAVIGNGTDASYLTLLATGNHVATWVNGIQVTDWTDTRQPDTNPRRGSRLDAGPIALQGHDPTTDVKFGAISITKIRE